MPPTMAISDVRGPYCRHVSVHECHHHRGSGVPARPSHSINSPPIDLNLLPRCFPTLGGPLCNQQWPVSMSGGHTAAMYRYMCFTPCLTTTYLFALAILSIRLRLT